MHKVFGTYNKFLLNLFIVSVASLLLISCGDKDNGITGLTADSYV